MLLNIIAAACENMGIGYKGELPWRLKKEMAFFKEKTITSNSSEKKNAVIMGRKTWSSIPAKMRPLPGRINIVLTTTQPKLEGADYVTSSFNDAVQWISGNTHVDKVFVIGGETVYKIAMESNFPQIIYLTRIHKDILCDAFFPAINLDKYKLSSDEFDVPRGIQEENGIQYTHEVYVKKQESPSKIV